MLVRQHLTGYSRSRAGSLRAWSLPITSLACPFSTCEDHAKTNADNIKHRKYYGSRQTRLLKCLTCGREFSETKGTPLWNSKLPLEKFIAVVEHIAEGHSPSSIVRTCKVHHDTIERIARVTSEHATSLHDVLAQNLNVTAVQADERWGFAQTKQHQLWESVTLDPSSKFVISLHLGSRTETIIRALLEDTVQRVLNPQGIVLFTDGLSSYAQVFPEVFGVPFQTAKSTHLGRPRATQYRIPRTLAHVQVIKNREGRKLKTVEVRVTHGSQKRVNLELQRLGYNIANTTLDRTTEWFSSGEYDVYGT